MISWQKRAPVPNYCDFPPSFFTPLPLRDPLVFSLSGVQFSYVVEFICLRLRVYMWHNNAILLYYVKYVSYASVLVCLYTYVNMVQ